MASVSTTKAENSPGKSKDVSIEDLSNQIEVLKADISGLTSTIANYTKAKSAEASATAKVKAREAVDAGHEKVLEAQLHAEDFVRTQPATALGLAAGLGFLIGMFTARR